MNRTSRIASLVLALVAALLLSAGSAAAEVPSWLNQPAGAVDSAGNVWKFERGEESRDYVVRTAPDGVTTRMTPALGLNYVIYYEQASITIGPEDSVWFTAPPEHAIYRLTQAGTLTKFALGEELEPMGIAAGPDGNLWWVGSTKWRYSRDLTTPGAGRVGVISPEGRVLAEYLTPTEIPDATKIISGPEGALWFSEPWAGKIARVTTAGQITEFPVQRGRRGEDYFDQSTVGTELAVGPEGDLWTSNFGSVVRMTTWGQVTVFPKENVVPGAPGIQLRTLKAKTHAGRVKLWLACGGSVSACRTTLKLGEITEGATVTIPAESYGSVTLQLTKAGKKRMIGQRARRTKLIAHVAGGPGLVQYLDLGRGR
jgi:virginiamycin B lyase